MYQNDSSDWFFSRQRRFRRENRMGFNLLFLHFSYYPKLIEHFGLVVSAEV
jgi:hypothetical protein